MDFHSKWPDLVGHMVDVRMDVINRDIRRMKIVECEFDMELPLGPAPNCDGRGIPSRVAH